MAGTLRIARRLRPLVKAAGAAIDTIKLNSLRTVQRHGRTFRVKHRRAGSEAIAVVANLFFHLAAAPITVCADVEHWQAWELDCYRLLNGDEFRAYRSGPRAVCQEQLPGGSLRRRLRTGQLSRQALEAAAAEIRRAHQFYSPAFRGPWSHGDLHLGNVIYEAGTNRARLIDFEIIHDPAVPATLRHADDLLVFLQDMVRFVPARQWLPFALCFLQAYGQPRVVAALGGLLQVPRGVPGLWWIIRSNYCERTKLRRRMGALREALAVRAGVTRHAAGRQLRPRLPGRSSANGS